MAITDAKIQRPFPVGSKNIKKSDGSIPTIRYVPIGANKVTNPGFEADVSGWSQYGGSSGATLTRDTSKKRTGAASGLVTRGDSDFTFKQDVTVDPGVTYFFAMWLAKGTGNVRMNVEWYNGTTFIGTALAPNWSSDTAFCIQSGAATAPANATKATVYFQVQTSGTGNFDDIIVQPCVPLVESPFAEPTSTGSSTSGSLKADPIASAFYDGDVKVFDMGAQSDMTLADSSYTRVYGARHKYAGGVLIDNGVLRVRLLKGYDIGSEGGAIAVSVLVDGAWQAAFDVAVDTGGDSDATINAIAVTRNARSSVAAKCTDSQGNSFVLTMERGAFLVRVETTRVAETNTRQDFEFDHANMVARVKDAGTIIRDADVTSTASTTGSALTEPYYLAFGSTSAYMVILAFARKPSTIEDSSSKAIWRQTSPGTSNYQRTFWVGAIPWPWLTRSNAFLCECESGTDRAGTPTTVADAAASGGNAVELNALNEEKIGPALVVGRDIPLGEYTLVVRAKDLNQVTDDLAVAIWNATDAAHQFVAAKTVTASYAFYTTDVSLTSTEDGDTINVSARKRLSNANTITVDKWYLIPKKRNSATPSHVFFPRDVARNALMQVTMRESVRKK